MQSIRKVSLVFTVLAIFVMFIPTLGYAGGFGLHLGFGGHHGHSGRIGFGHGGYGYRGSYGRHGYGYGHRGYGYGRYSSYRRHGYGYRNRAYGYNYPYYSSYGRRTRYGGSGYSSPYYRNNYVNDTATYGQETAASQVTHSNNYDGTTSPAWAMLGSGEKQNALNTFANEAQSNPNNGVPKAGYAMAYASLGDLDKGVWAMRRAFRISPDSLHYINLDAQGSVVVEDLINVYRNDVNQNPDAAFMVASLSYIHHDYHTANEYAKIATSEGDTSASVNNLQRLINEQL